MIAQLEQLSKLNCTSAGTFNANKKTSIDLNEGEIVMIAGHLVYPKKTLLTVMGCLLHPNDGIVEINGKRCIPSNSRDIALIRQQTIGYLFKYHNLNEGLNAEENIAFPLRVQRIKSQEIRTRTSESLRKVDLYNQRKKMLWQLSQSEKRQLAIGQALVTNPKIIICDNPTAFLDGYEGDVIMRLLRSVACQGIAIAIVNYDRKYQDFADKVVQIENGIIIELH